MKGNKNMFAENYDQFMDAITTAEMKVLNSCDGQLLIYEILENCLEKNPKLTAAEWSTIKRQVAAMLFHRTILENPELKNELAHHVYNELRKG